MPDTKTNPKGIGKYAMNIFDSLQTYGGNWNVTGERSFTDAETALVNKAEVVPSQFGLSVCFFMKSGGTTYIPLSNTSSLAAGDAVDMSQAKLITLHRDGDGDITRVQI